MFENVGANVKTLAKVVCWLGIIASIIGGIVIWVSGGRMGSDLYNSSYSSSSGWGISPSFLTGLLTMVIGSFFSWLASLTTYAIGEAAEYAEYNAKKLLDLEAKLKEMEKKLETSTASETSGAPVSSPAASSDSVKYGDKWCCHKCGKWNDITSNYCKECGSYR